MTLEEALAKIELLEEQNFLLREALAGESDALLLGRLFSNLRWNKSKKEKRVGISESLAKILACLLKRPVASKEMLATVLYAHRAEDWPDVKTIDVQICSLRKIIHPLEIETIWGRGWKLSDHAREELTKEITQLKYLDQLKGFAA